ncbi:MAG: hypothetical protein ACI4F5_00775 [Acutalibacteraceae bacterium]
MKDYLTMKISKGRTGNYCINEKDGKECGYYVEKRSNADENTVFGLNHFSHNGGYTYDELFPIAQEKGFLVSYDSMEVEF